MKSYLAVGIGGVIGTLLRYIISVLFMTDSLTSFPWATLIVNLTGAFLLSWIVFQPYFIKRLDTTVFIALTTGLIGSYTTFSTLMLEVTFLLHQHLTIGILYVSLTIFGGLFACYLGYLTAKKPIRYGVK